MRDAVIQLAAAFCGALGFAVLFGMRRRYLFTAALGGMLAWAVYLLLQGRTGGFAACLAAAAFAVLYAEVLARLFKTPATLFVIPAVIPLVPGGTLYSCMDSAVRGQMALAKEYGSETLNTALAIAAGMSFVIACRELRTKREKRQ